MLQFRVQQNNECINYEVVYRILLKCKIHIRILKTHIPLFIVTLVQYDLKINMNNYKQFCLNYITLHTNGVSKFHLIVNYTKYLIFVQHTLLTKMYVKLSIFK